MYPSDRDSTPGKARARHLSPETASDYEAHAFSELPRRVFLDTSVVNALVKFGPQRFEQVFLPGLEPPLAEDVNSLININTVSGRAPWEILSSTAMLDELAWTCSENVRRSLLS